MVLEIVLPLIFSRLNYGIKGVGIKTNESIQNTDVEKTFNGTAPSWTNENPRTAWKNIRR